MDIYTKRQQCAECKRMKTEIKDTELLIYVDYSENHKHQQQNEILSAEFGYSTFSLFTACAYTVTLMMAKLKKLR